MRKFIWALCAAAVLLFTACAGGDDGRGQGERGDGQLIYGGAQALPGENNQAQTNATPPPAYTNGGEAAQPPEQDPTYAAPPAPTTPENGDEADPPDEYTQDDPPQGDDIPTIAAVDPQAPARPDSWSVGAHSAGFLRVFSAYYRGEGTRVFLTFELTYEGGYTARVLNTLGAMGVRAAFFLTLPYIYYNADLVERMVNEGHVVGLRSHAAMTEMNEEEVSDMLLGYGFRELFGQTIDPFLRPAYGAFDEHTLQMARHYGFFTVFWSVWHTSWAHAADLAHGGAVIALSNFNAQNAAALYDLIEDIRAGGFTFASLYELI